MRGGERGRAKENGAQGWVIFYDVFISLCPPLPLSFSRSLKNDNEAMVWKREVKLCLLGHDEVVKVGPFFFRTLIYFYALSRSSRSL